VRLGDQASALPYVLIYARVRSCRIPNNLPKFERTGWGTSGALLIAYIVTFPTGDFPAGLGLTVFSAFFFFIPISYHPCFPAGDTQAGLFGIEKIRYRETIPAPEALDCRASEPGCFCSRECVRQPIGYRSFYRTGPTYNSTGRADCTAGYPAVQWRLSLPGTTNRQGIGTQSLGGFF